MPGDSPRPLASGRQPEANHGATAKLDRHCHMAPRRKRTSGVAPPPASSNAVAAGEESADAVNAKHRLDVIAALETIKKQWPGIETAAPVGIVSEADVETGSRRKKARKTTPPAPPLAGTKVQVSHKLWFECLPSPRCMFSETRSPNPTV